MTPQTMKTMMASGRQDWETPQDLYDEQNRIHGFTLDACATAENTKCAEFLSPECDGLRQPWDGVVWCNPPYHNWGEWAEKAWKERFRGVKTVMLLPARTDTKAFHAFIHRKQGVSVEFLKGRIKFVGADSCAPFPSMIVVFNATKEKMTEDE
jgi:phage N-6-adenine-methyltransferase